MTATLAMLIFLSWTMNGLAAMLCFNCATNTTGQLICKEHCDGEKCVVWKYRTRDGLQVRQGCLVNSPLLIGCRRNQVGAQLCICDDGDLCNRVERAENTLQPLPIRFLPSVSCEGRLSELDTPHAARMHFCRSNYCHYTASTRPEYDFDLRTNGPLDFPGLYPNAVYRITAVPNTHVLALTCSTNNCTSRRLPELRDGPTQCYVFAARETISIDESKVGPQHFCYGHFCFIQRVGSKVSKGCLSLNEESARDATVPGYRRILEAEQWLCRSHLCNWDLERVDRSWNPPTTPLLTSHHSSAFHFHFSTTLTFVCIFLVVQR